MSDKTPMPDPSDGPAPSSPRSELVPTTQLARAEVVDLVASREPFARVPDHLRPHSALPGQELLRLLGPDLICRMVQELEDIYYRRANTHVDLRLHFHEGLPRRADFVPVQAFKLTGDPPGEARVR